MADIVASVLASVSATAAEVVAHPAPISYTVQSSIFESGLTSTGDVVGALLSAVDTDIIVEDTTPAAEVGDADARSSDDGNRRPRVRQRVDPLALLEAPPPVAVGATGADLASAVASAKSEVDLLKRRYAHSFLQLS